MNQLFHIIEIDTSSGLTLILLIRDSFLMIILYFDFLPFAPGRLNDYAASPASVTTWHQLYPELKLQKE